MKTMFPFRTEIGTPFMLFMFFSLFSYAQNLVPNPGFEDYIIDPESNRRRPANWIRFDGTTDFFHRSNSSKSGISVPKNFRGYQEPLEGDGCAGIISVGTGRSREFIGVALKEQLEAGTIYTVSLWVNLSNDARFSSDDIGISFSDREPSHEALIDLNFRIKREEGRFVRDTVGWTKIEGYYQAEGNEAYLIIGNFYEDRNTDKLEIQETIFQWTYFYVDEVSVAICPEPIFSQKTIDTLACAGVDIELKGLPKAENYYWEGFDVRSSLLVSTAGTYVVNNYFECENRQLIYEVGSAECDCTLRVVNPHPAGKAVVFQPSANVIDYDLEFFGINGRAYAWLRSDDDADFIPQIAEPIAWRAKLICIGPDDFQFENVVRGKLIVIDAR
ncbi:MAG: hypothetical protein AAFO94_08765 [Bacteroidota bacterium]